jgi:hypothetical protein
MKKSKKWITIIGIILVLAGTLIIYGRAIFMYLFINYLLICNSEEECKKEYARFLQDKRV